MTYDDLQDALRKAQDLHRLTRDPLLLSAIALITPYLDTDAPDDITLRPQAQKAYDMIHHLAETRDLLFM